MTRRTAPGVFQTPDPSLLNNASQCTDPCHLYSPLLNLHASRISPMRLPAAVLGMGLTMQLSDFAGVFRTMPQLLLLGMALQYTVMPALGWAFSRWVLGTWLQLTTFLSNSVAGTGAGGSGCQHLGGRSRAGSSARGGRALQPPSCCMGVRCAAHGSAHGWLLTAWPQPRCPPCNTTTAHPRGPSTHSTTYAHACRTLPCRTTNARPTPDAWPPFTHLLNTSHRPLQLRRPARTPPPTATPHVRALCRASTCRTPPFPLTHTLAATPAFPLPWLWASPCCLPAPGAQPPTSWRIWRGGRWRWVVQNMYTHVENTWY